MARISVELPDEVAEALIRAAASQSATPESVLTQAALDFVAVHDEAPGTADDSFGAFMADRTAFEAFVAEAEDDVAGGRVHPFEQVMDEVQAIIDAAKAR